MWNIGDTTPSIQIIPESNSIFTVKVFDENGCTSTASAEVNVHTLPEIAKVITSCSVDLKSWKIKYWAEYDGKTIVDSLYNNPMDTISKNLVLINSMGCRKSVQIARPNCTCEVVETPVSKGDKISCGDESKPLLHVAVPLGYTVDWYDNNNVLLK